MVRCTVVPQEPVLEIVLVKVPLDDLLLMEREDSAALNSERGKLTGERVVFPFLVPEHFDLERLEEGHDTSNADEVE